MEAPIVAILTLMAMVLGFTVGWLSSERFQAYMSFERHDFEELFEKNPHPELFDSEGKLDRGDYMNVTFEPGYDPDEFDPEDIHPEG